MKLSLKIGIFLLMLFGPIVSKGQNIFVPLGNSSSMRIKPFVYQTDSNIQTGAKPYITQFSKINRPNWDELNRISSRRTWFGRKLKSENLVQFKTTDFFLTSDVLVDLTTQINQNNQKFQTNTRGFRITGAVGNKFSFFTSFYENQAFFPKYLNDFVQATNVVPGQGRVKPFKKTGYDYAMASGMMNVELSKNWNMQFGHHKNFIGDGYRSLLLSDNTFNYPHLKFSGLIANKKIFYQTIYAQLINLNRLPATSSTEPQFERKAATFHLIDFLVHPKFSIALFEGIIWQRRNNQESLPINYNFFNPIPFFNSAVNGFDTHRKNHLLGSYFKIKPVKNTIIYGQYMLDDLKNTLDGFQLGAQYFIINSHLKGNILLEYNKLDQNIYAFGNGLSYTHYNQMLALPSLQIVDEVIAIIHAEWYDYYTQLKYLTGNGFLGNTNVLRNQTELSFGYIFNRQTGLRLSLSYLNRKINSFPNQKDDLILISFATALTNKYYDF